MGGKRTPGADAAVSEVVGVVLMLAMSVAMAGSLYVWIFGVGSAGGEPSALSLTSNGAFSAATENKAYTVAATTGDYLWNDLLIKVDGTPVVYDSGLSGTHKFCVSTGSGSCIDTATWNAAATPVGAGHVLTIHDADLAGKKVQVIDAKSGTMLLTLPV